MKIEEIKKPSYLVALVSRKYNIQIPPSQAFIPAVPSQRKELGEFLNKLILKTNSNKGNKIMSQIGDSGDVYIGNTKLFINTKVEEHKANCHTDRSVSIGSTTTTESTLSSCSTY